jgi:hypothetical protein
MVSLSAAGVLNQKARGIDPVKVWRIVPKDDFKRNVHPELPVVSWKPVPKRSVATFDLVRDIQSGEDGINRDILLVP